MDYGARWYDPAVGRFTGVDPLAEKTFSWSGYNYVLGNPIRLVDPFGLSAEEKDAGYYRRKAAYDAWQAERDAERGFYGGNGGEKGKKGDPPIKKGDVIPNTGGLVAGSDEVVVSAKRTESKGGELLHAGDFYFTKEELFEWGVADTDVNNWILSNAPIALQKEYFRYARDHDLGEAAGPVAFTLVAPLALIGGAEIGAGASLTSEAIGPIRNWVRIGVSRHKGNRYYGMRWGAGREKYLKEIGSKKLRDLNVRLRKWRGGHWDWWKLK